MKILAWSQWGSLSMASCSLPGCITGVIQQSPTKRRMTRCKLRHCCNLKTWENLAPFFLSNWKAGFFPSNGCFSRHVNFCFEGHGRISFKIQWSLLYDTSNMLASTLMPHKKKWVPFHDSCNNYLQFALFFAKKTISSPASNRFASHFGGI